MGFRIPQYLKTYLEDTKYRKPLESFVSNSTYYSQLDYQWLNYMETIVRPCVAWAFGAVDGLYNTSLSTATGMAIQRGVTRLLSGEKSFFLGDDESCKFLSDIWAPATNFNLLKSRAISFMLAGGTSILKMNRDGLGRHTLSAFRIDRVMFSVNDEGDVTHAFFFIGLLTSLENQADSTSTYWLVEERGYDENGEKFVCYKVFHKAGIANAPVLPSPSFQGVTYKNLPSSVQAELKRMQVNILNEKLPLSTHDGLGVWAMRRTGVNSCVPDAPLGDPLLYGCLDLLWSIDVVFSGSIVDVLNGEGKILVPKQFLQDTLARLKNQYPNTEFSVTTAEIAEYKDESFVYIMPSMFDKDKMTPTPVQFDIRADQYGKMLEIYERLACVRAGYSPTSIFPYLTPDNSAKTAREVTAEENLTRASIQETHNLILPVFDRALREILLQEGFVPDVRLQLGDYIGNKLEFDENIRANYHAGLIPREEAVMQINNLSVNETKEWLEKLDSESAMREEQRAGNPLFSDSDYYGGGT